jgi:hypothetical protein
MRKVVQPELRDAPLSHAVGIPPESIALVEVTSEDPAYTVESALQGEGLQGVGSGWRAGEAGRQKIRIVFAEPQTLRRISLVFEETARQRTQEFTLGASRHSEGPFVEVVRQQWTFSPPATIREAENYDVDLSDVAALELVITPEISGGSAHASLRSLRLY